MNRVGAKYANGKPSSPFPQKMKGTGKKMTVSKGVVKKPKVKAQK